MNFNQILDWLAAKKEAFATLGVIVTISATVIGGFWAGYYQSSRELFEVGERRDFASKVLKVDKAKRDLLE